MNEDAVARAERMRGIKAVPEGWSVVPLKTFLRPRTERQNDDLQLLSVYRDHGVVPFGSIEGNHNKPSLDLGNYKTVREGDLVLNKMKTWQGSLAISDYEGIVSPAYVVCKVSGGWDRRYLHHLLRSPSFVAEYASLSYGIRVGQWDMRFEDFREVVALHPPIDMQHRIVDYLDSETARIDSLIDRKQRFVELLLEKRTALITHIVTKGLDPDVEMKDSGVSWLGDIPRHWQSVRIKNVAALHSGHTPDKKVAAYWDGGTIPWVSLADSGFLRSNRYIDHPTYCTTEEGIANSSAVVLPARSVILSRDATVGLCAIANVPLAVSQHFMAWVCGDGVVDEFLLYVLDAMKQELERLSMGSTIPTIGLPHIKNLAMPLPPLDEQEKIIAVLQEQTANIDQLSKKTCRSIDLLREYRTALISAVVTGQIDIPGTETTEEVA